MGFMDKAKERIGKNFGEETVQIVSYDAEVEDQEAPEPRVKKQKAPKPPRPPREKRVRPPKERKPKPVKEKPVEEDPYDEDYGFEEDMKRAPRKAKEPKPPKPKYEESAFAIDEEEEDFFSVKQKEYDEAMAESDVPDLTPTGSKIADVLEVLEIPPTFEIEKNIFLPGDLEGISFDLQAPYGFEQGQVTTFVERTKLTVERFVELLKLRNEHVAKLASVVDRLQVNNNNLRYQNEISNGINIMPTQNDTDLESKLVEARLEIKRLQEKLNVIDHGDKLSSAERERYDNLQDELSILAREKEGLEEEVYTLKSRLAYLEEEYDFSDEDSSSSVQDAPLPIADESPSPLPLPTEQVDNTPAPRSNEGSAFYTEEEESTIDVLGDDLQLSDGSAYYNDDVEEDPLDSLMRDWNK